MFIHRRRGLEGITEVVVMLTKGRLALIVSLLGLSEASCTHWTGRLDGRGVLAHQTTQQPGRRLGFRLGLKHVQQLIDRVRFTGQRDGLRWRLGCAPEILPGPVINPKAPNSPLLLVQEVGDGLGIQLAPVDGATSIRPVLVGDALDITAEDLILPLELAKDCPDIVLVLGSHFSDWNSPFVALHALLCCQHFFL